MPQLLFRNPQGQEAMVPEATQTPDVIANLQRLGYSQVNEPITGGALSPVPSMPFVSSDVSAPTDISGLQPAQFELTPKEKEQTTLESELQRITESLAERPAFEAEKRTEFGVLSAQQGLDDLNTQLRDLQRQQQLVPLAIQQESMGRGRTEGGVEPLEIGRRRALAYDALATASFIDAAQGRLASAERKVVEAVNQKFATLEARERAIMANLKIIKNSPETTLQEQKRIAQQEAASRARTEANNQAKEEAKRILSWADQAAAAMAKQGTLDAVVLNQIKDSDTEAEAAQLAAPYLREKEKLPTGDIGEFKQFFPSVDLTTPEGQRQFLDWKVRVKASELKPDSTDGTPEAIDAWARRISAGTDKISSVPTNIRNSVVAKSKEFAQEDLQEDIQEGLSRNLKKEDLTKQLQTAYPEFSKIEIEKLVTSSTPTKAEEETKKGFFGKVGSFFSSLFR